MSNTGESGVEEGTALRTVMLGPEIPENEMAALERSMSIAKDIANKVFKSFAFTDAGLNRVSYRHTQQGNSYGYYISPLLHQLYALIVRLGANSVLDLGCGACIALEIVRQHLAHNHTKSVKFGGIEVEADLIKQAHAMFPNTYAITHADLMKIERKHIAQYDILYMWEPIYTYAAARDFVDNLAGLLHVNQTIILKPQGCISEYLAKHPNITELKVKGQELALFHRTG